MTGRVPLAGRVVAVTGGANGIGREIAGELAREGARVAIGDRDGQAARQTAMELAGDVLGLHLDVTDGASFEGFLEAVEQEWGPLDVLVSNAGVMWVGPFEQEPDATAEQQIAVNLLGLIRGVKLTAPAMAARGYGHIVSIASAASVLAPPGEATYAATKHGVLGYLTAVREELRGRGVELSVIMPTVVDTDLAAGTASGAARPLHPSDVARAVVAVIRRPRFEVTVPGYVGPLQRALNVLPRHIRDAAYRRLVPDQVKQADPAARAGYEAQFLGP